MATAPVITGLPRQRIERFVRNAATLRRLGGQIVAESSIEAAREQLRVALALHHREHPSDRGMPLETLRRSASGADGTYHFWIDRP